MKERQARGGAKSGRYMKHDTARLRCLQRVVYFGLCAARLYCPTCGQERETAKAALVTARDQGATDVELAALEKTVASATCWSSTIDPCVMSFMVQRFPFLAMEFPAFVPHRSAVSKDTWLRSRSTWGRVSAYGVRDAPLPRVDLQTWQHLKTTVPKISDTYVAATTRSYVEATR